jgi:hypothetical protein
MIKRGATPKGVAFLSCWVTQSRGALARRGDVYNATRANLDDEKGKDWPKP